MQRQVQVLVRAIAESGSDGGPSQELLRFAIDAPVGRQQAPTCGPGRGEGARSTALGETGLLASEADPAAILAEIRSLIADGQVLAARRLAAEAALRFPDHAEIGSAKRILNDGRARVGSRGGEPNTDKEFEWLRSPPPWARGKWVALVGNEAIASADTLVELVATLRPMQLPRQPLVHRID